MKIVKTMYRHLLLFLLTVFFCSLFKHKSCSQASFQKSFGGVGDDVGYSVQQTTDGGYIITGWTNSFGAGSYDVCLIKTDSSGNQIWSRTFGGAGVDRGFSVHQTIDGGYIIAGQTFSFGTGLSDIYLIKTNNSGNLDWSKTIGGANMDIGIFVQQTTDKGYIIAGETQSFGAGSYDAYLIKTDSSGILLWTKIFGNTNDEYNRSVQQTTDGGYIIAGYINDLGTGTDSSYLIKTDSSGNPLWSKFSANGEYYYSVQQTTDGGYIIAGFINGFGAGSFDVYLSKTDSIGNPLWSKAYGSTNPDISYFVQQTTDGGYIITGITSVSLGDSDAVYLIKTDSTGNPLWTKTFGGAGENYGVSIQQTTDGGYIIAGGTNNIGGGVSDVYLIKTDGFGNSCNQNDDTTINNTFISAVTSPVISVSSGGAINAAATIIGAGITQNTLCSCNVPTAGFGYADSLLSVSFTDASSYSTAWSWDFGDGNTDTVQNPAHAYAADGAYEVCLKASNICGSDTVCDSVYVTSVGIGNAGDQQVFVHAYPNPFSNKTSIAFSVPESSRVKLNVFNISGGVVATLFDEDAEKGKTYNLEFNSTGLPGGVYFYNLLTDEGSYTNKLVIIKQ